MNCYVGSIVRYKGDFYRGTGVILEYVERTIDGSDQSYYILGMEDFHQKSFNRKEEYNILNTNVRHGLIKENAYPDYAVKGLWCIGPEEAEYLDIPTVEGLIENLRGKVND